MVLAAARDMQRRLDLSWPVDYRKDMAAKTCRIDSDPSTRRHLVTLPTSALDNVSAWRPSLAHELCHAYLAENVDPIFSAWRFPKRYSEFTGHQLAELNRRAQEMYLSTSFLIDVWVDDLRHRYWPDLTSQELAGTAEDLRYAVRIGCAKGLGEEGSRVMAIALHVVSSERHGGQAAQMDEVNRALPAEIGALIREVAQFMQTVPRLSYNRAQDLQLLERYAQESARLLNAPFVPHLAEEEGVVVWEIMDD